MTKVLRVLEFSRAAANCAPPGKGVQELCHCSVSKVVLLLTKCLTSALLTMHLQGQSDLKRHT